MPAFTATTLAIIGAVGSAVSFVQQQNAQSDAKDAANQNAAAQQRQAALEQRRADIQNARNLRSSVRQSRMARAQVLNTGANVGTSQSSGVIGGAASIVSQENANIGFNNQMTELNSGVFDTQVDQAAATVAGAEANASAATWGAVGGMAGGVFKDAGGYKTIFGTQDAAPVRDSTWS